MRSDISGLNGAVIFDWQTGHWRWRDGELEPRLLTMGLEDLVPQSHRVTINGVECVEFPNTMSALAHELGGVNVVNALRGLIAEHGKRVSIRLDRYCKMAGLSDVTVRGWRVPAEHWDAIMREPAGVRCAVCDRDYILRKISENALPR